MPSVAEKAVADAEYDTRGRELYFNQTYGGRWDMQAEFGVADGQVIVLPQLVGGDVEERDRGGNRVAPLTSSQEPLVTMDPPGHPTKYQLPSTSVSYFP